MAPTIWHLGRGNVIVTRPITEQRLSSSKWKQDVYFLAGMKERRRSYQHHSHTLYYIEKVIVYGMRVMSYLLVATSWEEWGKLWRLGLRYEFIMDEWLQKIKIALIWRFWPFFALKKLMLRNSLKINRFKKGDFSNLGNSNLTFYKSHLHRILIE